MRNTLFIMIFVLVVVGSAGADRGPVTWQENVSLSQESQKAIILHNGTEEVLILGTELKASSEIDLRACFQLRPEDQHLFRAVMEDDRLLGFLAQTDVLLPRHGAPVGTG